jgi:hypothetical protein
MENASWQKRNLAGKIVKTGEYGGQASQNAKDTPTEV